MSWLLAIALAIGAFVLAAFVLGVSKRGWTTLAAALAAGLAGYGLQASPGLPGAPAKPRVTSEQDGFAMIEARKEMVAESRRSRSNQIIIADAMARRGRYADAATLLRGAIEQNPNDAEAWLAMGNALVEHADGRITKPAMYAYRRSDEADPSALGPGYFLGLAAIREGGILEGRQIWAATLDKGAKNAAGREAMEVRLARLDQLIAAARAPQQQGSN